MSISSQSQVTGCHSRYTRGFSLVELLISITIIGIITSVVLVKFTDFDSTTILKGVAYEVAATVREAQMLSISVLGVGNQFRSSYGINFVLSSSDYIVFRDSSPTQAPSYMGASAVTAVNTYTMMRGITVSDLCVKISDISLEDCDVGSLDVSFLRPEFTSRYYVRDQSVPSNGPPKVISGSIESAIIKLKSDKGDNEWRVEIGALGHISVVKD